MNPISRFINEIPDELLDGVEEANASMFGTGIGLKDTKKDRPKRKAGRIKSTPDGSAQAWAPGDKAKHKKWGTGTVVKVQGEGEAMELDIAFPAPVGIKRVLAQLAPITKE